MIIFVIALLILIIYLRVNNEKKHFMHFKHNQSFLNQDYKRYWAVLETNRSSVVSTNHLRIILTEDAIVFQKNLSSCTCLTYELVLNDIVSFRYNIVSRHRCSIKILHAKNDLPSPYKLTIVSKLSDVDIGKLDNIRKKIYDNDSNDSVKYSL